MRPPQLILATALLTICAFCTVLYTSCKKEKNECLNINCLNGGACNYGKCICPTGYGGTYCEISTDLCKNVTCLNGGTCKDGKCACPTGSGGTLCESVYRDGFAHSYKGSGTDDMSPPNTYTNWKATFSPSGTDITRMQLILTDNTGSVVLNTFVMLSNFITGGASFTINTTYSGSYTYTGSGTFSENKLSLRVTETSASSSTWTCTFTNMLQQ